MVYVCAEISMKISVFNEKSLKFQHINHCISMSITIKPSLLMTK